MERKYYLRIMKNARKNRGMLARRFYSLKAALDAHDLKQNEAARILGKSEAYVSKLVNRRERPSLEIAVRIEQLWNVDPSGLL